MILEEEVYFNDLEDYQLPQILNPSRNLQTLWGQLAELPSLGPAIKPNRKAAAFVSPTACSIYSIRNSVSWVFKPHIRLPLLPHA